MNSFSAVHVNCTRLIMPNSPRGIQCSFIILCDETLQMTWLPEDKSGVLNFMLLIIFVLGVSPFWKRQCQPWWFGCKLATSWFWQFVCFALHLCEHPLSCAPHLCRHFCRIYFNMGSVFAMCVLGLASPSLSQLAAFSSDWLLKERELCRGMNTAQISGIKKYWSRSGVPRTRFERRTLHQAQLRQGRCWPGGPS